MKPHLSLRDGRDDLLAVLVVANTWGRSTVAAALTRSHADDLAVNSTRDAVLQLQVHLGYGVLGEDGGIRDITNGSRLDHVADGESLDCLVLGRAARAVAASDGLGVAAALLVATVVLSLLDHFDGVCCEPVNSKLAKHAQELISTQLTALPPIDLSRFVRPFGQVEFIPGLEQAMGVRLPKLSSENALPELLALLKLAGIAIPGEVPNSLPKLLDRLAAVYLEPMSFTEPLFITNHPVCMSPLAKGFLCPQTYQLVSARAELFVGGRELANMYEEENDPEEQKRKLAAHRTLVNKPNGEIGFAETEHVPVPEQQQPSLAEEAERDEWETCPLDSSYIKALDYGLPPTGGWGCGVERLVMLFSGANRISDCLSFGTLRNVVGLSSEDKGGKDA